MPFFLAQVLKFEFSLSLYPCAYTWCKKLSTFSPSLQTTCSGHTLSTVPACNYWSGIVLIYLFLCELDKCGLLNMAKMNEPIISRQDTRQAGCFDLQGYVNKYQWHVLFFGLLCLCSFWVVADEKLWIHPLWCWVWRRKVPERCQESRVEEQLPEPCYRCYFCHIISALHILAHMLERDRGVSKLVSISKIKFKKK